MSVSTLCNIPITASYTIPATPAPRDADSALTFTFAARSPALASRARAHTAGPPRPSPGAPGARLTHTNNTRTVLRHAPLRPVRGHIVDAPAYMRPLPSRHDGALVSMRAPSHHGVTPASTLATRADSADTPRRDSIASVSSIANMHSIASCSMASQGSIGSIRSIAGESGIGSTGGIDIDDRPASVSDRESGLSRAGSVDSGLDGVWHRQVSEAAITITDDTPGVVVSEHVLTHPADGPAPGLSVRAAIDALLAECQPHPADGPAGRGTSTPLPLLADVAQASQLYQAALQVHRALFDPGLNRLTHAAAAIADAAARLLRGAAQDNIELVFVGLGLRHANDSAAATQSAMLGTVGQLRSADHAQRRELDAALDLALDPQVLPRTRRIAHRIVNVTAEVAHASALEQDAARRKTDR